MSTYDTNLSNLSYTNKDFNTIYPELLELADRISYKWEPSSSNESDPGVVLLKLNALMADKLNYNIDKNILELFPISVTQDANAREIFEQCGYTMKHYIAASVPVLLTMYRQPKNSNGSYNDATAFKLPKFFMISDVDNETVYTVPNLSGEATLSPVDSEGQTRSAEVEAIQGTVLDFTLNGSNLITTSDLDYNNRLYFNELNVAENGIFIQNVKYGEEVNNFSDWIKVDNLMVQELGTSCYKFGVSRDANTCYIEFPTDIASLIGEGLHIKYIVTDGYDGNVATGTLTQFYGTVTAEALNITSDESDTEVEMTTDLVRVVNPQASFDGADPESIDEAYRNYEKIKGTFDTLVSLRDYTNFLKSSGEVSNGFVCDRTNDIQSAYKIISTDGDIQRLVSTQHRAKVTKEFYMEDSDGTEKKYSGYQYEPEMNAVQLRMYGLTHIPAIANANHTELTTQFNLSFQPIGPLHSVPFLNLDDDLKEVKTIKHDFVDVIDRRILNIILEYPIEAKIIPYTKLTSLQEIEIYRNIYRNIFTEFNSAKIDFGKEIDYDKLHDTILKADNRIKSVMLQELQYTAKVMYYSEARDAVLSLNLADNINASQSEKNLRDSFKNDIVVKSVLAGATPFIDQEQKFKYSVQQTTPAIYNKIGRITTETKMNPTAVTVDGKTYFDYEIRDTESIIITRTNLINAQNFQNMFCIHNIDPNKFSKFQEGDTIALEAASSDNCEYIALFAKASASAPILCYLYFNSTNLRTAHTLIAWDSESSTNTSLEATYYKNIKSEWKYDSNNTLSGAQLHYSILSYIQSLDATTSDSVINDLVITGTSDSFNPADLAYREGVGTTAITEVTWKSLENILVNSYGAFLNVQSPNTVTLNKSSDCNRLYWILNKTVDSQYQLFDTNEHTYTLQNGEYLYYSNPQSTILNKLGAGTVISRPDYLQNAWRVDAISGDELFKGGVAILNSNNLWFKLTSSEELTIAEQQFYILGHTSKLRLESNEELTNTEVNISGASYYDPELKDYVKLPKMHGTSDYSWKCRSRLNLIASIDKPQLLEHSDTHLHTVKLLQTFNQNEFGLNEFTNITEIKIEPLTNVETYIQSHLPVELIGGESITCVYESLIGVRQGLDLYVYNSSKTSYPSDVTINAEDSKFFTKHTFKVADIGTYPSCSTKFTLPEGEYIIPFITYVDGIFTFTLNGNPLDSTPGVSYYGARELDTAGIHYLKFNQIANSPAVIDISWKPNCNRTHKNDRDYLEGNGISSAPYLVASDCTLEIKSGETLYFKNSSNSIATYVISSNSNTKHTLTKDSIKNYENTSGLTEWITFTYEKDKSTSIIFRPIVKYTKDSLIEFETLEKMIREYDYNNLFDYTYIVPAESKISNPLEPKAFLESNHPFNRCTICKALVDPNNDTILLTNRA